jgi:hypothetical protein
VISRGDGRVEVSLESPASAGLFRFCGSGEGGSHEPLRAVRSVALREVPRRHGEERVRAQLQRPLLVVGIGRQHAVRVLRTRSIAQQA